MKEGVFEGVIGKEWFRFSDMWWNNFLMLEVCGLVDSWMLLAGYPRRDDLQIP